MSSKTICIIGGGFSGVMVAVHLIREAKSPIHLVLVNSGHPLTRGVAYSSYSNKHLLNVAAKNMSAFPDQPDHFLRWIRNHENYGVIDHETLPGMFLPRNIYGHYIKEVFDSAIRKKPGHVSISFVHDEAIDIEVNGLMAHVYFKMSPTVVAHQVVLATGNHEPQDPKLNDPSFYSSRNYFRNPWAQDSVNNLDPDKEVLIIGNGLTMVDVVMGLKEKQHRGKIYSLSPNGFRILPHRTIKPYTGLIDELAPPYDLNKLVSLFRKHLAKLRAEGGNGEMLVDTLRPLTQKIWQTWSLNEKKRFMFHIRHIWGVARHRLPMSVHHQIQEMILDDKLEIIAGRLKSLTEHPNHISVSFIRRTDQKEHMIHVNRVINCTGPQTDVTKMRMPIIENLLRRGYIDSDEMRLGMRALADGTVIGKDGQPSDILYTIGSNLKGILWESTAVPELRMQAKNLSAKLLESSELVNA
jgi:uncharacterized NAD(P)/FAD-binding protein YdhS